MPVRTRRAWGTQLVLGLALAAASASELRAQDEWTYYTDTRRVRDITHKESFLWIASSAGVTEFDKRTKGRLDRDVTNYSTFDGMAANSSVGVAIDGDGKVWCAHDVPDAGLSVRDTTGIWRIVRPSDGLLLRAGRKANTIFASGDSVWAGTESGATLFVNEQVRLRLDFDHGLPSDNVQAIWSDGTTAWIGTDAGLARVRGAAVTNYTEANGLYDSNILSLGSRGSQVLVGTLQGLCVAYVESDTVRIERWTPDGLADLKIRCIDVQDTLIWVGTDKGLARLEGASWRRYVRSVGNQPPQVENLAVEVGDVSVFGGEVWAGFLLLGAADYTFLNPAGWRTYALSEGLSTNQLGSMDIDSRGTLWLTSATKRDGRPGNGENVKLVKFAGTRFIPFEGPPALGGAVPWTSLPGLVDIVRLDPTGRIWLTFWDVRGGLNHFTEPARIDTFDVGRLCSPSGAQSQAGTEIRFDADGNVWTAFDGFGITCMDPETDSCVVWDRFDGLPTRLFSVPGAGSEPRPPTNSLAIDRAGRVWAGYDRPNAGGFLSMIDPRGTTFDKSDDVIVSYGTSNSPVPSTVATIHATEVDSLGRVWFGTESGLVIFSPDDSVWTVHASVLSTPFLNLSLRSIAFLPDGTALIGDNAGNVYSLASDLATFGKTYNRTTVGFPTSRVSQIKYDAGRDVVWFALFGGGLVRLVRDPDPTPPSTSNEAVAWPNPFVPEEGDEVITFDNLRPGSNVGLYTLAGEMVRDLSGAAADSSIAWDTRNDRGEAVASGIYFFIIRRDGAAYQRGKVAILR